MRLIDTTSLALVEFYGDKVPSDYAILSHTWEGEEVTFWEWQQDMSGIKTKRRSGFQKIDRACRQARKDGLAYLWVDTNCIDKSSSAELSEAINSMFSWYRDATVCYAYLCDVEPFPDKEAAKEENEDTSPQPLPWAAEEQFICSKWFTRGWTLQELLAPTRLVFYASDWSEIGSRQKMTSAISLATQIHGAYLHGDGRTLLNACVAEKMSWVSERTTTRVEDIAYCMLGIFDINMPLLYGEGTKAFVRLQEEIIKVSNDQTIFCWTWVKQVPDDWISMLAPCHQAFRESGGFRRHGEGSAIKSFGLTNAGLSIILPLVQTTSCYLAVLDAGVAFLQNGDTMHAAIPLYHSSGSVSTEKSFRMKRGHFPPGPIPIHGSSRYSRVDVYIPRGRAVPGSSDWQQNPILPSLTQFWHAFLLVFDDTFPLCTLDGRRPGSNISCLGMPGLEFHIKIFSQDPCYFAWERGLLVFRSAQDYSCALVAVKIGQGLSVLFLGLGSGTRRLQPVCRPVSSSAWENLESKLSVLQEQKQKMIAFYEGYVSHERAIDSRCTLPYQAGGGWLRPGRVKRMSHGTDRLFRTPGYFKSIPGPVSVIHVTKDKSRMKQLVSRNEIFLRLPG